MRGAAQRISKSMRISDTVWAFSVILNPFLMSGVTPEVKPSILAAVASTPHAFPEWKVVYLAMSLRVPAPTAST